MKILENRLIVDSSKEVLFDSVVLKKGDIFMFHCDMLMDLVRIGLNESLTSNYRIVSDFPFHIKIQKLIQPKQKTVSGKLEEYFDLFDFEVGVKKTKVLNKQYKEHSFICLEAITYTEWEKKKEIYHHNPVSVIPHLYSETIEDLKKQVKNFVTLLIRDVTKPVCYCPYCNGNGIIFEENLAD